MIPAVQKATLPHARTLAQVEALTGGAEGLRGELAAARAEGQQLLATRSDALAKAKASERRRRGWVREGGLAEWADQGRFEGRQAAASVFA